MANYSKLGLNKKSITHIRAKKDTKNKLLNEAKRRGLTISQYLDLFVNGKIRKNKKAQLSDIAIFLISILSISIIVLFAWVASDQISQSFQDAGLNSTTAHQDVIEGIEDIGKSGDTIFSIVIFGLTLALLLSAILIPTNIVFMIIYLIGVFFIWMVSPIISNAYNSLTANGAINTAATSLPITNTIMNNLPIYMTFLVFVVLIILYAKGRSAQL